jgi:CBS domain-containing protein
METVRSMLRHKGPDLFWLAPEATVYEAVAMMADKSVGALLVLSGGKLAGIVSERDYARKVILKGSTPMRCR